MSILPPSVTLFDFATNDTLFGHMKPLAENWFAWNTLFKVRSNMKLTKKEEKFFSKITGGLKYRRGDMPKNFLKLIGRKGGKSFDQARNSEHRTLTFDFELSPGERARNLIIAPSLKTGMIILDFVEGLFDAHESLRDQVIQRQGGRLIKKTQQMADMHLKNRCEIALMPVTRVSGRGPSTYTLMLDEAAHFKVEGRFSDQEVFLSARPGMARFGNDSIFDITTTPYYKEGLVYDMYQKYFGVENDYVLVIQASTKEFNPTISEDFLEQELQENGEDYFKREYLAQFTDSVCAAFSGDIVESCVISDRSELPYREDYEYFGFMDPAGLQPDSEFNDEFVSGVAHNEDRGGEKEITVIDAIRGWTANKSAVRKSTPDIAISESLQLFERYHVTEVSSDKWGHQFIAPRMIEAGIDFKFCPLTKWDLYLELVPIMSNAGVEMPDDKNLQSQLKALERKRGQANKDRIDKVKGRHDDRANVAAGLAYMGAQRVGSSTVSFSWV